MESNELYIIAHSWVVVILVFAMYFLPYIVARCRGHNNASAIGALTLLMGWTMLGWVGALVWAFTANTNERAS